MMSEYKSTEQSMWETLRDSPTGIFTKYMGKSFYGCFASQLRIPTVIRKTRKKQTWIDAENDSHNRIDSEMWGGFAGAVGAVLTDVLIGKYVAYQANHDNPLPLYIAISLPIATNLASGIYEHVKLMKENKGLESKLKDNTQSKTAILHG